MQEFSGNFKRDSHGVLFAVDHVQITALVRQERAGQRFNAQIKLVAIREGIRNAFGGRLLTVNRFSGDILAVSCRRGARAPDGEANRGVNRAFGRRASRKRSLCVIDSRLGRNGSRSNRGLAFRTTDCDFG